MIRKQLYILCFLLLVTSSLTTACAKKRSDNTIRYVKDFTFTYQAIDGNFEQTCYYTDNYFQEKSTIVAANIANYLSDTAAQHTDAENLALSFSTASLCFAMSTFNQEAKDDYASKYINAYNYLVDAGFDKDSIGYNDWYTKKPEMYSMGVICATKKIKFDGQNYNLLAVGIRGGNYEAEWGGNFILGETGNHEGFTKGKDEVLSYVKQYIADRNLKGKTKIWVVGFSRGGAVANMFSGEITNHNILSDNIDYTMDDVYALTFEAPSGVCKEVLNESVDCKNIVNILNPNDIIPLIPPAKWEFGKYGINCSLPSKDTCKNYSELYDKANKFYSEVPNSTKYNMYKKDYDAQASCNVLIDSLVKDFFISREIYKNNFEPIISEALATFLSEHTICESTFSDIIEVLAPTFVSYAKSHPVEVAVITLYSKSIVVAHSHELTLSWFKSMDSNYKE